MKKLGFEKYIPGLVLLLLLSFQNSVQAQIAQFRGPNRDGKFPAIDLLKEWPEDGPEKLFVTKGLGKTNSSTIANNERIFTTGNIDTIEYVSCLDFDGNILWQKPYGRCWNKTFSEARCTPTLEQNRLYVLTGLDVLSCFNALDGELIWQVDIHKKYRSVWDMFGVSESPLLVGNKIIITPCGPETTVIALDKFTGELVWKSKSLQAKRSNMSPALIEHCGIKYLITSTQTHVLGLDPDNGDILWTFQHNYLSPKGDNATILVNVPTYSDSCLWISNGWDVKSTMLEIAPDGKSVKEKFTDQTFDNQNHGMVLVNGYLYGSNFTGRQSGKWICMNWKSGEIVWIGDFHNKGPVIFADDMLYFYEEKRGNMALVKADPKKFEVISSFRVNDGTGPHWSRPAIYNGMLLVRHGDVLVAYNISGTSTL